MNGQQSTFVTVLAWLALIGAGLQAVMGILQSVLVALVMPIEPLTVEEAATTPLFFRIVFENFRAFVFGFTAFWTVTFICALGLLRRREWARRAFIALLALATLTALAAGVAQQVAFNDMFAGAEAPPAEAATLLIGMRVAAAVMMVAFVGAFGWVVYKLNSRTVRAEFENQ